MDDIPQVNPDPDPDPLFLRTFRICVLQRGLYLNGTPHGLKRAGKLQQKTVANRVNLPAPVLRQEGSDQPPLLFEKLQGKNFVPLGKRGESDHVGEHDRSKPSLAFELFGILHHLTGRIIRLSSQKKTTSMAKT